MLERQEYRLLIVDKYFNYINLFFIDYKKRNCIMMLVLSFRFSYQLKLYDNSLLLPLNKAHSKKWSNFIMKSQGFVSMTKNIFYLCFKKAWEVRLPK